MNTHPDIETLKDFAKGNSEEYKALNRLIQTHLEDLVSVTNIDFEGNVGLQAFAQFKAHEILEKIFFGIIQPERSTKKPASFK